jgi:drug/metabolite transporter (DMT)-like permease
MKLQSGAPILFFAAFLFSLTGIFNRLAGEEFGPGIMLLVSAASATFAFLVIILVKKTWKRIEKSDLKLIIFRGFLLIIDFPSFFIAVIHIELGLALLAYNASSIITNFIYGKLGLGEKISRPEYVALILALIGLLVVNVDNLGTVKLFYVLSAMLSGMAFSLNGVTSKKISTKYPEVQ